MPGPTGSCHRKSRPGYAVTVPPAIKRSRPALRASAAAPGPALQNAPVRPATRPPRRNPAPRRTRSRHRPGCPRCSHPCAFNPASTGGTWSWPNGGSTSAMSNGCPSGGAARSRRSASSRRTRTPLAPSISQLACSCAVARASRSISNTCSAPREAASSPRAPVPANRSRDPCPG